MARTHGMRNSSEYRSWSEMKQRCFNTGNDAYVDYGGRGITVHSEWIDSFEDFYAYIGPKPTADHTIDRIDVNGNYEPGNIRWATRAAQSANRRNVKRYDFYGQELMLHEIDSHLNAPRGTVNKLISRGFILEEIAEDIVFSLRRLYRPTGKEFERTTIYWNNERWTIQEIADHFDVPYGRVYALLNRHKDSSVEYAMRILSGTIRDRYNRVQPGDIFGNLKILREVTKPNEPRKWLVECSCGNGSEVSQSNLVTGHIRSCGCLRLSGNKSP